MYKFCYNNSVYLVRVGLSMPKSYDANTKAKAVGRVFGGEGVGAVAHDIGCHYMTVSRWVDEHLDAMSEPTADRFIKFAWGAVMEGGRDRTRWASIIQRVMEHKDVMDVVNTAQWDEDVEDVDTFIPEV